MKAIRRICLALVALAATSAQAQVIEYHQQGYLSKDYLRNIDSVRYVPAQDWSIKLAVDSFRVDSTGVYASVLVTVGPDAHVAKAAVGKDLTWDEIVNDSVSTIALTAGTTQEVEVQVPADEPIYFCAVTRNNYNIIYDNHLDYHKQFVTLDYRQDIHNWAYMGTGRMMDDLLTTAFFDEPAPEYNVTVMKHKGIPGFYRVVNPYTDEFPYKNVDQCDSERTYYLDIHAEDSTFVWFDLTYTGLAWGQYGNLGIWSMAGYYLNRGNTPEEIKAAELNGTMANGVISFPRKSIMLYLEEKNGGVATNNNGQFRITLPKEEGQSRAAAPKAVAPKVPTPMTRTIAPKANAFRVNADAPVRKPELKLNVQPATGL